MPKTCIVICRLQLSAEPNFINKKDYKALLNSLEGIWDLSFYDLILYEPYLWYAIRHKAFITILPLLIKLNDKFPNNSKLVSRLGKTLCTGVVARYEEGLKFIKLAIKLLCDNKNRNEVQKLLIFYFYKLLSNDRLELLKNEMNFYKNEIEVTSNFLVLTSKYFQKLGKPNGEIIKLYKESLSIANYKEEKMNAIKGLWCYLSTINTVTHKSLFEELITMNIELANDTD